MMTMARIELHQDIDAPGERVFELLADLHGYGLWLPSSGDYRGTSEISPPPVRVGTTYRETSPRGVRNGVVTGFDPPRTIAFHQPMRLRPRIAGTIDSVVTMTTSTPDPGATRVTRLVELRLPRRLALLGPLIERRYRVESERMLRALKSFAEDDPDRPRRNPAAAGS